MLIDTHAHLHVKEFDNDREATIERARQAGVKKMINVGFDAEGNFQALALAKKNDDIWASMGIHPHIASEWNDHVAGRIHEAVKKEEKIVALGEMGLDYYKNFQPVEVQKTALRGQLKLAQEVDLPVIIHCRDAFKDMYEILDDMKIERVLLHCFTGTLEEAKEGWKRGYYTAFTGIVTYPSAKSLRKVVSECPLDRLILETDCPFLSPQSKRTQRNEPAFMVETLHEVCGVTGKEASEIEHHLEENVRKLFVI